MLLGVLFAARMRGAGAQGPAVVGSGQGQTVAVSPGSMGRAVLSRDAAASPDVAWTLLDGFESPAWPDPGLWLLPQRPAPTWWPSMCQARTGRRALRAFGGGRGVVELPCDAEVPPGSSSTITMRLDLRDTELASRIDLYFDLWLLMPPGTDQGLFIHLLLPTDEGVERVPVFGATSTSGQWVFPSRRLDLMNVTDIAEPGKPIDLRGGVWLLQWTGYAPRGAPAGGGIFIDDVSLVWEPDAAVPTPTPWHTATPTATSTPSSTPTPRPTATITPTPEPVVHLVFAPLVRKDPPPTATATATATATSQATQTVSPSVTASTPSASTPTASPSPTDATPGLPTSTASPSVTPTSTPEPQ